MNEIIVCRDCVNSDCIGCNMLVLYHALERNRFKALMNENHHLNIDTDVAPVRHGRWIELEDGDCKCSLCGCYHHAWEAYGYYCQHCGAKMDKDGNKE